MNRSQEGRNTSKPIEDLRGGGAFRDRAPGAIRGVCRPKKMYLGLRQNESGLLRMLMFLLVSWKVFFLLGGGTFDQWACVSIGTRA